VTFYGESPEARACSPEAHKAKPVGYDGAVIIYGIASRQAA